MIVIDEDGDAKTAHPPTPESPLLGESTPANEPPPAYSSAGHPGNSQPARTASGGVLYYAYGLPNPHPRAEPARRRFIRAFCVAVAVWLLLSFLGQSFVDLAQHEHRSSKVRRAATFSYNCSLDLSVAEDERRLGARRDS